MEKPPGCLSAGSFVSVIIPVHNSPGGLTDTLRSLMQQTYPSEHWEVIVVDNNSTDLTRNVAESFAASFRQFRVLRETEKQSSYAARNRGIEAAQGDILAFLDADMTVAEDWLWRGVDDFLQERGDYIGCRVEIYTTHTPPTIWEMYDQRAGFPIRRYLEIGGYSIGGSLWVRRSVFDVVGMFDERLVSSGDLEFGNRVRDAGITFYYNHDNVVKHPARATWRSNWNKHFRIGKGHADLSHLFPGRYGELTLRSIMPLFRPSIRLKSYDPELETHDLPWSIRMRLLGVAYCARCAHAFGRLWQYFYYQHVG